MQRSKINSHNPIEATVMFGSRYVGESWGICLLIPSLGGVSRDGSRVGSSTPYSPGREHKAALKKGSTYCQHRVL